MGVDAKSLGALMKVFSVSYKLVFLVVLRCSKNNNYMLSLCVCVCEKGQVV
jgi:hypothetical protein